MRDTLESVLQGFYDLELNVTISSFWDGGWWVKIGDEINGFTDVAHFDNKDFGSITKHLRERLDNEVKRFKALQQEK